MELSPIGGMPRIPTPDIDLDLDLDLGSIASQAREHASTAGYIAATAATIAMIPKAPRAALELGEQATSQLASRTSTRFIPAAASGRHAKQGSLARGHEQLSRAREWIGGTRPGKLVLRAQASTFRAYEAATAYWLGDAIHRRRTGDASNRDVALAAVTFAPGALGIGARAAKWISAQGRKAGTRIAGNGAAKVGAATQRGAQTAAQLAAKAQPIDPRAAAVAQRAAARADHALVDAQRARSAAQGGGRSDSTQMLHALRDMRDGVKDAQGLAGSAASLARTKPTKSIARTATSELDAARRIAERTVAKVGRREHTAELATTTARVAERTGEVTGKASLHAWNAQNGTTVADDLAEGARARTTNVRSLANGVVALIIGRNDRAARRAG